MQCRWCVGTGEECGCGQGVCAHCDKGEMPDPPGGAGESRNLRRVLSDDVVSSFVEYWNHPHCDDTIGDFIQRIAQYAVDNLKYHNVQQ